MTKNDIEMIEKNECNPTIFAVLKTLLWRRLSQIVVRLQIDGFVGLNFDPIRK